MNFQYYMPVHILFGRGRLKDLATLELPGKKALIVTGGQSARKYGYLDKVQEYLKQNGVDTVVFDKVQPNPAAGHIDEAAGLARRENCEFIIGLGGGSAIDSAKAVAIMVDNGDYAFWDYVKGKATIMQPVLPIVAVPTTAGSGSEANSRMVVTNADTQEKISYGIKDTFPLLSIIDPELSVTVPPRFTAYQGMEALFHATEAYLADVSQPLSRLYALDCLRRINRFLPDAVRDGNDLQAREETAWASTLSGMTESVSDCFSGYSLEYTLSAFYPDLPHGAGLAALSVPYYNHLLKKNGDRVAERYMDMAQAMGEGGTCPEDFPAALSKLIKAVGLSELKLSDWGISKKEAEKLAESSFSAMSGLPDFDTIRLDRQDAACIIREAIN